MFFSRLYDYIFALPQYLLPHHMLSRIMLRLTRIRITWLKNIFVPWFIRHFKVDMSEAVDEDWRHYPDFNSFFTRAIKPEVRPITTNAKELACPVDGTVSQAGHIQTNQIFQAKGHSYSLQTLVGDTELATQFENGHFATLYLSPRDYHRIHMPVAGQLKRMIHVPGRLFSVNPATARTIPGLFARNERVVAIYDTEFGPMAMILVGAIFVASIETIWHGVVTPPKGQQIRHWDYTDQNIKQDKGEEMGRFNMGSTVIVLFGPDHIQWHESIKAEASIRMGQTLGTHS